jgi:hypothetical protein
MRDAVQHDMDQFEGGIMSVSGATVELEARVQQARKRMEMFAALQVGGWGQVGKGKGWWVGVGVGVGGGGGAEGCIVHLAWALLLSLLLGQARFLPQDVYIVAFLSCFLMQAFPGHGGEAELPV